MKKYFIYLICLLFVLFSCRQNPDQVYTVQTDLGSMKVLDVRSVTDSSSLILSDFAENIEIVRLETIGDALITSYPLFYVGKNYIIAKSREGKTILFSQTGKFEGIISEEGQGPDELSGGALRIDSKFGSKGFLFERSKENYFLQFDIDDPGNLVQIPYAIPGQYNSIQQLDSNTLLCSPSFGGRGEASKNILIWQDLDGNLIHAIKNNKQNPPRPEYGVKILHKTFNSIKYRPVYSDTLYVIEETELKPEWYFDCKNPPKDNPRDKRVGDVSITVKADTKDFFLFHRSRVTKHSVEGNNSYTSLEGDHIYLDKNSFTAFFFYKLHNDYFEEDYPMNKLIIQSDGEVILYYDAIDLILLRDELLKTDNDSKGFKRLDDLYKQIKEDDNPILLIGQINK